MANSPSIMPRLQNDVAERDTFYAQLPLFELLSRIAREGDEAALHEFHVFRTPFISAEGRPQNFAEYAITLTQQYRQQFPRQGDPLVPEQAYDKLIDRFICSPRHAGRELNTTRYYQACIARIEKLLGKHWIQNPLEQESAIAKILQSFVAWQFSRCIQEMQRRSRKFHRRHQWRHNGVTHWLWRPLHIAKPDLDAWLEREFAHTESQARDEVQFAIEQHFGHQEQFTCDLRYFIRRVEAETDLEIPEHLEAAFATRGVAAVVADEKASAWRQQRPAIRKLGREGIRALVLRVLRNLPGSPDPQTEQQLALEFGLTQPTFSRFAGMQWLRSPKPQRDKRLPDLFENLAKLGASHGPLVDVLEGSDEPSDEGKLL